MKVHFDQDEWWPVFTISRWNDSELVLDMADEEVEWIKKTDAEFDKVQDFISKKLTEAGLLKR